MIGGRNADGAMDQREPGLKALDGFRLKVALIYTGAIEQGRANRPGEPQMDGIISYISAKWRLGGDASPYLAS